MVNCLFDSVQVVFIEPCDMLSFRTYYAVTSTSGYAFFAAGKVSSTFTNIVDVFDASGKNWTFPLSQARSDLAATSLGNKVYFGGGYHDVNVYFDTVDICDADTGKPMPSSTTGSKPSSTTGAPDSSSSKNIPMIIAVVVGFVALVI